MTKIVRMLAGGGLAAVLGISAFASASAESPPNPPSRFAGTVLVDGAAPPAGTSITAKIGNTTCGVTTTFNTGAASNYKVDVPALDPGATPNCGTDGATVSFFIGDKLARETGKWANSQLGVLNLTYVTPPTATPTGSTTPGAGTPGAGTPGAGTPGGGGSSTVTPPKVSNTGTGLQSGSDSNAWLFVALGLGAVAFGIGGATVAKRNR